MAKKKAAKKGAANKKTVVAKKPATKKAAPAPKKAAPKKELKAKGQPVSKKAAPVELNIAPALKKASVPVIGAQLVETSKSATKPVKNKKDKSQEPGFELDEDMDQEFEEDERARVADLEEEEGTEGPPPWWKDDPAGIEDSEDEDADEGRAVFDDSDEWTEDDEWESDPKTTNDFEDENW